MVKKITYYLLIVFFIQNLNAQIVNVESLRLKTDTLGWAGSAQLNFSFKKNVNEQLNINNNIHVQYKFPKHLILFFNKVGFSKTDGSEFTNEAMQHLRYNYKFSKKFSTELFLQNQYNAISKIEYRRIIGAGIRWKISPSEKFKVYLGNLIMFESEKSKEQIPIYNQDWKNSTYLSYTLLFTENAKLISTSYIQPKFIQIKDFRFSHQTSLSLKLLKNLSFSTNFFYAFDSNPVDGIPKKEYELTNGISYSF